MPSGYVFSNTALQFTLNKQSFHCLLPFLRTIIVESYNKAVLNRKFHTVKNWYQFFTAREKMVPIRYMFHTNISHFVNFAHVVKLYVAYMRNFHIDKIQPKSAVFAFDSNSSHTCEDFITWFKQVTGKFHMFYS